MLRITTQDCPRVLVFRLEGRLDAGTVAVLDECLRDAQATSKKPRLCVDLAGVTFVDAAGKARLAEMHRQGAEFVADNLVTNALVGEIAGQ